MKSYYRVPVEGRKLTTVLAWRQFVAVEPHHLWPSGFAIDLLRYDRCFLPESTDVFRIMQIYEHPMEHPVLDESHSGYNALGFLVAKFTETRKSNGFTWTVGNWRSHQWDVDLLNKSEIEVPSPQKLTTSLKYAHLAVVKPILEPDGTGRPLCQLAFPFGPPPGDLPTCQSFPFELMQKELAYTEKEVDSGKISDTLERLSRISASEAPLRPIVLKKYLPTKVPTWAYADWDMTGWDLQPIDEGEAVKYS